MRTSGLGKTIRTALILACGFLAIQLVQAQDSAPSSDQVIRLKGIVKNLDDSLPIVHKNWLNSSAEQQKAHSDWLNAVQREKHSDPALRSSPQQVQELARIRDEKTEANNRNWQAINEIRETQRGAAEWLRAAERQPDPGNTAAPRDIPPINFDKMPTLERLKKLELEAGKLKDTLQGGEVPPTEAAGIFRRNLEGDTARDTDAPAAAGTPFFNKPANPAPPEATVAAPSGSESRARFKCPDCGQWFYDTDMPRHLEVAHRDFIRNPSPESAPAPAVQSPPAKRQSPCGVCGKMIPSDELARHVDAHRPRSQCPHCNVTYYTNELPAHIAVRHPAPKPEPPKNRPAATVPSPRANLTAPAATKCPRCNGSGYVGWGDIDRLGMRNHWIPGPCQLCGGRGTVTQQRLKEKDVRSLKP